MPDHRRPECLASKQDQGQNGRRSRERDWPESADCRFDDRDERIVPCRQVLLDLINQDHTVPHDDAGECNDAEDRNEAEGSLEHEQCRRRTD